VLDEDVLDLLRGDVLSTRMMMSLRRSVIVR